MQDKYLNNYKEKIILKLQELENRIAQSNNQAQIDEVRNYRESIQNNILMAEFAESDGMKILLEYVRLEKKVALMDILNSKLFFTNKKEYLEKVELAWQKIHQVDWFLDLLTGRQGELETWEETLNEQLGIKEDE